MPSLNGPQRLVRSVAVVAATVPLAVCAPAVPITVQAPPPAAYASAIGSTRAVATARSAHVILISIDGLRPDAIEAHGAETLGRMILEGSHSLEARTILPSITLPSHTSMLTGVGPETHGITWNDNRVASEGVVESPTILSRAHDEGLHTAAFFSKGKFQHLLIPGSVNFAVVPDGNSKWLAARTAEHAAEYLERERPNLTFVHLADTDFAGHTFGWMGKAYGWAVRRADAAVATIITAADRSFGRGNYTVLVTADHGGHGRTHGTSDPRDVNIPWIAWGRGVRASTPLPAGIHTTDTAATALWLLGIEVPAGTTGAPVIGAFQDRREAARGR